MAYEYRIKDQGGLYFITCTVHQWVDVFTRETYIEILLSSLRYCQEKKGLKIYAWVVMSNHIHLIVQSSQNNLSDIIRDFKKFTASTIYAAIENNKNESRKNWLLWLLKKEDKVCFWEPGYHGEEIFGEQFLLSKINYIHNNPVRAGIVLYEEAYKYSSCSEFYGTSKSLLELSR
ncbi:transposase [Ferruginibacter yonginensis]|uniref:Transposase n=1 Tax=Ferruginibacter yonginensis TaxID=1310416 RepID=A0ABV8QQT4_9BACT